MDTRDLVKLAMRAHQSCLAMLPLSIVNAHDLVRVHDLLHVGTGSCLRLDRQSAQIVQCGKSGIDEDRESAHLCDKPEWGCVRWTRDETRNGLGNWGP